MVRTSFLVLVWSPCPFSSFLGLTGYPNSCGGFSFAARHQVNIFRLRWNHWSWLCHRWTLTGSRFLTSLWHGALLCDRIRKKIAEMAAREHRKTHYVEQMEKMIPLVTRKTPLVRMSASWFLVSAYLIWILGTKLILSNNQSRATLWVLETCLMVGLLPFMIILITASLSTKKYNWRFIVRRMCWWVRNPHLTIAQTLAFSFQLMFWFWFCWWNGLLSRTSCFVLQCCLWN